VLVEVKELRDRIFQAMASTDRETIHRSREAECVEVVARIGNVELLTIFLNNINSVYSLRSMRDAYREISSDGNASPSLLINDHGMKMRDLICNEMTGDFFQSLITPVCVMAMGMQEEEVYRVISIIKRGIISVEGIRAMLQETEDVKPPLRDGAL